jgi:hypothetical protein
LGNVGLQLLDLRIDPLAEGDALLELVEHGFVEAPCYPA